MNWSSYDQRHISANLRFEAIACSFSFSLVELYGQIYLPLNVLLTISCVLDFSVTILNSLYLSDYSRFAKM